MKNYIIGFLVVCIAALASSLVKDSTKTVLERFPMERKEAPTHPGNSDEPPLYLYIFFSQANCHVCMEAIQVLNHLPAQFPVTGIVPWKEMENETQVREKTGAKFPLIPFKESYRPYVPNYSPSIFGVAGNGKILFVLPGVPGQVDYLYDFLTEFYGRSLQYLLTASRAHAVNSTTSRKNIM